MRVLGIDPGARVTGWGLIESTQPNPRLLDCGCIRLERFGEFSRRLAELHAALSEIVRRLEPETSAVEAPFHGVNARSALQLAHARGVVLAVLGGSQIEVVEYSPAIVKKAITGNGRASKEQVQAMIERLLGSRRASGQSDTADALGVALCHAAVGRYGRIVDSTRVTGEKPRRQPAGPPASPLLKR